MPILERATIIPNCTPEEVFEFCLHGANFPKIFPEPVRPVGSVNIADLRIEQGREFQFWHWMFWCIPAKWRVRIAEVKPNEYFIDEMLNGPMKSFRHQHIVSAVPGGTLYTDRVTYSAIGGRLAGFLLVDRYMARIFDAAAFPGGARQGPARGSPSRGATETGDPPAPRSALRCRSGRPCAASGPTHPLAALSKSFTLGIACFTCLTLKTQTKESTCFYTHW